MDYGEFCQAFYIDGNESCLNGVSIQKDIATFFLTICLDDSNLKKLEERENTTYDKWFSGKNKPREFLKAIKENFDAKSYANEILRSLDERNIEKLIERFGVQVHPKKGLEKRKLAEAITA